MKLKLNKMLEGPVGMVLTIALGITYVYLLTAMFGGF